jgi:hypothetical protein
MMYRVAVPELLFATWTLDPSRYARDDVPGLLESSLNTETLKPEKFLLL